MLTPQPVPAFDPADYAERCRREADDAPTADDRLLLIEMAEEYEELARRAARRPE